jgi:hypothetical protein
VIAELADYAIAFDLAREAAVEAEPLSAILPRVMVTILSTLPADQCGVSRVAAIRQGVADAMAGRSPLVPSRTAQWSDDEAESN